MAIMKDDSVVGHVPRKIRFQFPFLNGQCLRYAIKIVELRHFTSASLMNKSTTAKTTKFNLQTIIQKP